MKKSPTDFGGCDGVYSDKRLLTLRRNELPPSSGSERKLIKQLPRRKQLAELSDSWPSLLFYHEDGSSLFLRKCGSILPDYTTSHHRR
jgi:hypothetical protein